MIDQHFKQLLWRILPHPVIFGLVFMAWLMLQHSLSIDNLLMALLLGWGIALICRHFVVSTPNIHWLKAIKLFFIVLYDVVVSNIRVAKLVLGPKANIHPKWYRVPLDTQHEQVNTILAMIITTTPGTVSAGIDQQRGDILVHSLSTLDENEDIRIIKQRYEQPLMQIYNIKLDTKQEQNPC